MGQFKKEQPFTHVLALDPGKKSGWALYELATERMRAGEAEFGDMCVWIERVATAYKDKLIVVCESFTITVQTAKNTSAPWSLEMIGAARSAAARHGCAWATPQAPSSAKRFSTNDQIRALDWWQPGLEGHAHDAIRHLILLLVQRGWWDDRLIVGAAS